MHFLPIFQIFVNLGAAHLTVEQSQGSPEGTTLLENVSVSVTVEIPSVNVNLKREKINTKKQYLNKGKTRWSEDSHDKANK